MKKKINKILYFIVSACCALSSIVVPSFALGFLPEGFVKDECIVYANMPIQSVTIGNYQYDEIISYDGINNVLTGKVDQASDLNNLAMLYGVMDRDGVVDYSMPFMYNSSVVRKSSSSVKNYNYSATTRYLFVDTNQVFMEDLGYTENWNKQYAYTDINYIKLNYSPFVYSYQYGGNYGMSDTYTLYYQALDELYNEIALNSDLEQNKIYIELTLTGNIRRVVNGIEEVYPISKKIYKPIGNDNTMTFKILDFDGWHVSSTQQLYTDFTVNINMYPFVKVLRTNSQVDNSYYMSFTSDSLADLGHVYNMTSVRYYNSDNNQGTRLQSLIDSIEQNPVIENEFQGDYVGWITTAVTSFMDAELFPNFKIGGILGIIVAIPVAIWFLKMFAGG